MTETVLQNVQTWRIEVRGVVQGVGFRPFVHRLATRIGLRGHVRNAGGYVAVTVTGARADLDAFVTGLRSEKPEAARVRKVEVHHLDAAPDPGAIGFMIADSVTADGTLREIPPDLATCADCLHELFDPADRRHRYPFVNCTTCGPRATIIEALPYDRIRTSMRGFTMCAACAAEYADPADRRFHAEPIACPACGPRLRFAGAYGDAALRLAAAVIGGGGVVAVKGLGGYQLVCDAIDERAVERMRAIKSREAKPLAVMVRDLTAAVVLAELTAADRDVLSSPAAPVLLAPRREGMLAAGVCDGMADIGLFLPPTPLHHLLLAELRRPLVVTSGNRADSPMIIDDDAAIRQLGPLVDGVLGHNRPILNRYDDSVLRSLGSRSITIRGARGLTPAVLPLPVPAPEPLLAVGAQLKSTFTLAHGDRAVIGPHIGDLEDAETLDAFDDALDQARAVHGVAPAAVAHDAHPAYLSTGIAGRWPAASRVTVQHHHAHVAGVAAEYGLAGPFLGVAYDGLGLGDDGTFWGGELLLATYTGYRRLARFSRAPMPGGAAAVRRPARMALSYLAGGETYGPPIPEALAAGVLPGGEGEAVRRMIERGVNSPLASSAGRLFDAAAALLGLCADNRFEGQAAMRLERAATGSPGADPLAWRIHRVDGMWVYDAMVTLRDLLEARADGEPVGAVAAAFHATIAAVTAVLCEHAAAQIGVSTVCLSGGVFQNRLLATEMLGRLEQAGFEPYIGERVPVNDGGISYGQAVIAAARLAGSRCVRRSDRCSP